MDKTNAERNPPTADAIFISVVRPTVSVEFKELPGGGAIPLPGVMR